jgi:hypothetical protein
MNIQGYNEAWTRLLAARREGNFGKIQLCAEKLAHEARIMDLDQREEPLGKCSHFMVANGHCINCHEQIIPANQN